MVIPGTASSSAAPAAVTLVSAGDGGSVASGVVASGVVAAAAVEVAKILGHIK